MLAKSERLFSRSFFKLLIKISTNRVFWLPDRRSSKDSEEGCFPRARASNNKFFTARRLQYPINRVLQLSRDVRFHTGRGIVVEHLITDQQPH